MKVFPAQTILAAVFSSLDLFIFLLVQYACVIDKLPLPPGTQSKRESSGVTSREVGFADPKCHSKPWADPRCVWE